MLCAALWRYLSGVQKAKLPAGNGTTLVDSVTDPWVDAPIIPLEVSAVSTDEALVRQVNEYLRSQNCGAAIPLLQKLVRTGPEAEIYGALGRCWVLENQGDSALPALEQAQRLGWREHEFWERKARQLQKEAQNMAVWESPHFTLQVEGKLPLVQAVDSLLWRLERSYDQLTLRWDYYPERKIMAVLYGQEHLRAAGLPDWTGALFDGKVRIPFEALAQNTQAIERILLHEVAHAFNRQLFPVGLPVWLDEGLAQIIDGTALDPQILRGGVADFANLQHSFARHSEVEAAQRLYQTALAMTQLLLDKYALANWLEIRSILAELNANVSLAQVLQSRWGITEAELHEQVQKHQW